MDFFVIICQDKADCQDLRLSVRAQHLSYLAELGEKVKLAGPFVDEQGRANGSMIMLRVNSLAEAQQIAEADPYAQAALFSSVTIRPWRWVVNAPEVL